MKVKSAYRIAIIALLGGELVLAGKAQGLTYQNSVDIGFTFNPVAEISISGGDLSIDNLSPGSSSDSNIITISTGSNSRGGYELYASVGSSTITYTDLRLSSSNTTNVFSNLSSTETDLASFSDNTWGYSYSTDSGTTWVNGNAGSATSGYGGLPAYNASNNQAGVKLVDVNDASSSSLQFKIGAKAASSQVAGTYTNVVSFLAVPKIVTTAYTVNYNGNSATSGVPAQQTGTTTDSLVMLSSAQPVKTNYTFKGWCDTYVPVGSSTCSGVFARAGGVYALNTSASVITVNLYAMWESVTPLTYMQDVATWGSSLNAGDEIVAVDNRDGKFYTVAKLADGNIWMTQNLDHDIVDLVGFYTYDNTDIGHGSTPNTSALWTGVATYSAGNATWNDSATAPESYDPGDLCWNGELGSYSLATGTTACGNDKHYHIGNYYNWTAAIALTSSSSYKYGNVDVNRSICPAGWMLPKGGTVLTGSGSFEYLSNQLGLTSGVSGNIQDSPAYFVYGGSWSGYPVLFASHGRYWSSLSVDSLSAYGFDFDSTGWMATQGTITRGYGNFVRCVARPV